MLFKKLPVVIEAVEFIGVTEQGHAVFSENPEWLIEAKFKDVGRVGSIWFANSVGENTAMVVGTLEGSARVKKGDMIIRGVTGELYPCDADIFEKTYEEFGGGPEERIVEGEDNIVGESDRLTDQIADDVPPPDEINIKIQSNGAFVMVTNESQRPLRLYVE